MTPCYHINASDLSPIFPTREHRWCISFVKGETVRDSKLEICQALRDLVAAHPLASISIAGICEKAGLSRKTFSRNFVDIESVITYQIYLDFIQPLNDITRIMSGTSLEDTTLIERNFHILKVNCHYYREVFQLKGASWFVEQLRLLTLDLDFEPNEKLHLDPLELDFAEHYFASSMAMVMRWWIERDMEIPEHEVAELANKWLYAYPREILSS